MAVTNTTSVCFTADTPRQLITTLRMSAAMPSSFFCASLQLPAMRSTLVPTIRNRTCSSARVATVRNQYLLDSVTRHTKAALHGSCGHARDLVHLRITILHDAEDDDVDGLAGGQEDVVRCAVL